MAELEFTSRMGCLVIIVSKVRNTMGLGLVYICVLSDVSSYENFCLSAMLMADMTAIAQREVVAQTNVLASIKQTTYGMPGQRRLHHGRISWEKKYL